MATDIRPPAVAGMFYPGDPAELTRLVEDLLAGAASSEPAPKAVIAPHAGYVYSGSTAAHAYARLRNREQPVERVVLVGPSHRVPFAGIAAPSLGYYETPLGRVPVDQEAIEGVVGSGDVHRFDPAHSEEHSLEVHLPFLQVTLGRFRLVPLVVGLADGEAVGRALERLWGGPETQVVISSDLSHYLDYDTGRRRDRQTTAALEALRGSEIGPEQACGALPIQGLLWVARRRGMQLRTLALTSSGDAGGPLSRCVGYGAYVVD